MKAKIEIRFPQIWDLCQQCVECFNLVLGHVIVMEDRKIFLSCKRRLYCCFIDSKKAFDSVDRNLLW